MKYKLMFLVLASLLSFFSYLYFSYPPYYIRAYMAMLSNSDNFERLSKLIEQSPTSTRFRLSVAGDLRIEESDISYSLKEKKSISKLMKEINTHVTSNEKDLVIFHVGEGKKLRTNFRVALVKKKRL